MWPRCFLSLLSLRAGGCVAAGSKVKDREGFHEPAKLEPGLWIIFVLVATFRQRQSRQSESKLAQWITFHDVYISESPSMMFILSHGPKMQMADCAARPLGDIDDRNYGPSAGMGSIQCVRRILRAETRGWCHIDQCPVTRPTVLGKEVLRIVLNVLQNNLQNAI